MKMGGGCCGCEGVVAEVGWWVSMALVLVSENCLTNVWEYGRVGR